MSAKQCLENNVVHWTVRETLRKNITTPILAFFNSSKQAIMLKVLLSRNIILKQYLD